MKNEVLACDKNLVSGGEGGIRTHVPVMDKTISSRSRYDLFDTSPNMFNSCRKLAKKRELPEGTVKNRVIKFLENPIKIRITSG